MIEVSDAHYTDQAGNKSKDNGNVIFHEVVEEDKAETKKQGRPIGRTRVYVKHFTPGDTLLEVDKPMKPGDEEKYPRQWAAFQAKKSQVVNGTPIEMWPQMSTREVYEFKAMNIFTVEQFAAMSEQQGQKIQGFHQKQKSAILFLKLAKDTKAMEEIAAQAVEKDKRIAEQDARIAQLEKASADLEKTVRELTASVQTQPVRRGGRPKKAAGAPVGEHASTDCN